MKRETMTAKEATGPGRGGRMSRQHKRDGADFRRRLRPGSRDGTEQNEKRHSLRGGRNLVVAIPPLPKSHLVIDLVLLGRLLR